MRQPGGGCKKSSGYHIRGYPLAALVSSLNSSTLQALGLQFHNLDYQETYVEWLLDI